MAGLTALAGVVVGVGALPAAAAPVGADPLITNLVDSSARVRVGFKDRSTAEDVFELFRRGPTGSWEFVGQTPTQDKAGARLQAELADPSPNALRCYLVQARSFSNEFSPALSRSECVGGGRDPFDTSQVGIAAPRVTSVRREPGAATQVRVTFVDRSRTESRFKLFRRQGANWVFLVESIPASRTGVGRSQAFFDTIPAGANACYTVQAVDDVTSFSNYSNEICLTPPAPLPAPPTGADSINPAHNGMLDQEAVHGEKSVAIGADGLPIIAFRGNRPDGTEPLLMVTHCNDRACGSKVTTPLDNDGSHPSIAIGRDGLAIIAYRSIRGVGIVHCSNLACTTRTFSTVDRIMTADVWALELAIGSDGLPTIAYEDAGRRRDGLTVVKAAHCRDAACTTSTVTVVDTVPLNTTGSQRIAVATSPVTGFTYVAYVHGLNEFNPGPAAVLKMTTCLNPACNNRSTNPIDRGISSRLAVPVAPGTGMSMAVGRDGLPLLSYDWDTGFVAAHCVNIFCTGITTTFYDHIQDGRVGVRDTSIAIGADGVGVVSYHDPATGRVKVAHCADLACTDATIHTVPTNNAGTPSIAIGTDGLPVISFGTTTLYLAHCRDAVCTSRQPVIIRP